MNPLTQSRAYGWVLCGVLCLSGSLYYVSSPHGELGMCRKATPVLEACAAQPVQTQLGTVDIMASLGTPNAHFDERQCLNFTLHRLSDTVLRRSAPPGSIYPRTLFYVDFSYVATVMDRFFIHQFCGALAVHSDAVHIFGPGWPGYNSKQSPAENVAKLGAPFDLVVSVSYSPDELSLAQAPVYMTIRHECVHYEKPIADPRRLQCAFHDGRHAHPWKSYNITLLTYENDLAALRSEAHNQAELFDNPTSMLSFWPHTVLPAPFIRPASAWSARPNDVCLVGQLHPDHYPLRSKFAEWMGSGMFAERGVHAAMREHPGYTEQASNEERASRGINATSLEQQYLAYIDFLHSCKLAFVTRSARNLEVRKYSEAALSGALLLGDVPDNPHSRSLWAPLVVDVSDIMEAGDAEQLVRVIRHWLSDGMAVERDWRLQRALLAVAAQRTAQRGWERMREAFHAYRGGSRGFDNPLLIAPIEL